ncbi:MAG: protein-glutamate O-methyltransferase CheR [Magnetococcales bacterium]|nr:protein-glutamate O-methyltransferase CheR [Magnetococcales bacterium]
MIPFDLEPFKTLIRDRCGLNFEARNEETLQRALHERIRHLAIRPGDYLPRLLTNEREFQELVNRLTINETYFFREPEQIRLLVNSLAPRKLIAREGQSPVRVLSAGCASGEEPYSLVMALMERYGESVGRLFQFIGCDIDSVVLAKARRACYTQFSFRSLDESLRRRYFHHEPGGGHCLDDGVKSVVAFHQYNLLADAPPPVLRNIDILFFRNVSIYFNVPTRRLILERLASLLREDGLLIVGISETMANDLGVLRLMEEDGQYYFVKGAPAEKPNPYPMLAPTAPLSLTDWKPTEGLHPSPPTAAETAHPLSPPLLAASPLSPSPTADSFARDLSESRRLLEAKRHDEALILLDTLLAVQPAHLAARLLKAHLLLLRKDFHTAEAMARLVLTEDSRCIDALMLLGLSAKWRQQPSEAIGWFKQVVYWRHECWPAHYYLADLYRACHETERARRGYRVVMQLLSGTVSDTGMRHIPLELPVAEIRFLCEHQLARLGMTPAHSRMR